MHLTINGLVIRTVDWRDSDRLLTVMTQDHGKLTVKAQGVRRRSSRFGPAGQLFAYSEMSLYQQGGHYSLNDAQVIEQFFRLANDLDGLALASYFCQLLDTEGEENIPAPDLLRLALNSLFALCNQVNDRELIKAAFELRFLGLGGYEPDLWACSQCSEPNPPQASVSLQTGRLHCGACRDLRDKGLQMPLGTAALQAARYVLRCDLKKLFSFKIPPEDLAQLARFAESYCLARMERAFQTLDFYKSLQLGG